MNPINPTISVAAVGATALAIAGLVGACKHPRNHPGSTTDYNGVPLKRDGITRADLRNTSAIDVVRYAVTGLGVGVVGMKALTMTGMGYGPAFRAGAGIAVLGGVAALSGEKLAN